MMMPKKVKFRKQQRGRMTGKAWRGSTISFGEFGLKALECGWVTDRQIEAARVAMTRSIKRGGKVWIRLFPDKPITKKPAETRMGKGKGAPEQWVAVIPPARFCSRWKVWTAPRPAPPCGWRLTSWPSGRASSAARTWSKDMKSQEKVRDLSDQELEHKLSEMDEQKFRLRFQMSMGQMDGFKKVRAMRKTRARILTVMRERELQGAKK